MPNFTLVLSDATTRKIRELNETFGGSVGGFAANFITDLAELDAATIQNVRQQLKQLAREAQSPNAAQSKRTA